MKIRNTCYAIGTAVALTLAGQVSADGNRYDRERLYKSEISVSEAYLAMEHSKGWNNKKNRGQPKPVLIDVRRLEEYAAGHPEDAYHVPYPSISQILKDDNGSALPPQDPSVFYCEVYDIVKGRMDTKIMLLCRTGSRSISAGNILANPGGGLEPFTNVYNIWEGFVGLNKYGFVGGVPDPLRPLDLNNDDKISTNDDDAADVYTQVTDYNPDKDGWRNFAGLPWTTKIRRPLAYLNDPGLYKALNLTPVE